MKKIIIMLVSCTFFIGCHNEIEKENIVVVKKAEILDIEDDRILVKPYDTIEDDVFYFLVSAVTEIDDDLKVGDFVYSELDDKFMMSYPGQVNAYKIRKLK